MSWSIRRTEVDRYIHDLGFVARGVGTKRETRQGDGRGANLDEAQDVEGHVVRVGMQVILAGPVEILLHGSITCLSIPSWQVLVDWAKVDCPRDGPMSKPTGKPGFRISQTNPK